MFFVGDRYQEVGFGYIKFQMSTMYLSGGNVLPVDNIGELPVHRRYLKPRD